MKKTRRLLCIPCIILILLCCSCSFFYDPYFCEFTEVESIQIIRLNKYVEEAYTYEYTVLADISDIEAFVERLNKIEQSDYWGAPYVMFEGYVVINITYSNGDYDWLHQDVQLLHRSGVNNDGYFFFDDEQFLALISDYWTETDGEG